MYVGLLYKRHTNRYNIINTNLAFYRPIWPDCRKIDNDDTIQGCRVCDCVLHWLAGEARASRDDRLVASRAAACTGVMSVFMGSWTY